MSHSDSDSYAHARYYSWIAGGFTTIDPLMASAQPTAPQTWNRYSYGLNNFVVEAYLVSVNFEYLFVVSLTTSPVAKS